MTRSRSVRVAYAVALLALVSTESQAQRSIDVFVGAGHTAADVEGWAATRLSDWSQFLSDGHAQAFLLAVGPARLGVEVGHSDFMWYEYNYCPNCDFPAYADRNVAANRVLAVVQFGYRFFAELAGGMHMFDGFNDWGAYGGVGVRIPLIGRLEVPVKARGGVILDSDQNLIPITLSAGLTYRLK